MNAIGILGFLGLLGRKSLPGMRYPRVPMDVRNGTLGTKGRGQEYRTQHIGTVGYLYGDKGLDTRSPKSPKSPKG
jgi:hypothetical protein